METEYENKVCVCDKGADKLSCQWLQFEWQ